MTTPTYDPAACTILVVDDEEMNRDMLCRRLERKGFKTLTANDGFEALKLVAELPIDAVFLDIMMPGLSGLEVLHTLRKGRSPLALPILVASAKASDDDVLAALKLGANDYLTKPLHFDIAVARLHNALVCRHIHQADAVAPAMPAARSLADAHAEFSADLHSIHGPDGAFLWVSPACEELLGRSASDLIGTALLDHVHPDDLDGLAIEHGDDPPTHTLVMRLAHADGSWVWAELRTRSFTDTAGNELVALTARDLSVYVGADDLPSLTQRVAMAR